MVKYAFLSLLLTVVLGSCGLINMRSERGNGNIQADTRAVKNFSGVESHGSFDVYATTDNAYSVKIETDENLLQYIETTVENGNLVLTTTSGVSVDPSKDIKVYVSAPIFNRLTTSGSGKITGQNQLVSDNDLHIGISGSGDIKVNAKAPSVSADISGSGNITLEGETKIFKSSIAGNGDIRAGSLVNEETTIRIAGSGSATVNASKELHVHIAGSGDVKYSGNPAVSQDIAGSGSIQKIK